jgi:hypothetical protein
MTIEWWQKTSSAQSGTTGGILGSTNESAWTGDAYHVEYYSNNIVLGVGGPGISKTFTFGSSSHDGAWHHMALVRDGANFRAYRDGVDSGDTYNNTATIGNSGFRITIGNRTPGGGVYSFNGLLDNWRLSNSCRYPSGTTFAVPADFSNDANTMLLQDFERADFSGVTGSGGSSVSLNSNIGSVSRGTDVVAPGSASATGTLISDTQTASSATTKMSGVILYKDNEGTATLGTDLKIYLSANNGGAWAEAASYGTVTPLFSTGVKMVRLGETTVTSGTAPVIKAVWANQASGSKETQLHGWAMNY